MKEYETFYGKPVHVLLDAKGYDTVNYSSRANVNLELAATITGETSTHIDLENIVCLNKDPLRKDFASAIIRKGYVIGVFEPKLAEEPEPTKN